MYYVVVYQEKTTFVSREQMKNTHLFCMNRRKTHFCFAWTDEKHTFVLREQMKNTHLFCMNRRKTHICFAWTDVTALTVSYMRFIGVGIILIGSRKFQNVSNECKSNCHSIPLLSFRSEKCARERLGGAFSFNSWKRSLIIMFRIKVKFFIFTVLFFLLFF
mgnify:CR=1 FL=1